jgi:hypothetical protein
MKNSFLLTLTGVCITASAVAGSRSSANYSVPADSVDSAGQRGASANYVNDASAGGIVGIGAVVVPSETARHGYIGQLYDVQSLVLSANPTNVDEGAARQLAARAELDDATVLNVSSSSVTWSLLNGPILSISAAGLATAANVYEDTPAQMQGTWLGKVASVGLLVRNVGSDDFGNYAGDGINDAWQVQYFGVGNPAASPGGDPDADGQNTGYEYVVGSIPVDGDSYFRFRVELVPGQPTQRNLIFSPRVAGRTYTVQYNLGLDAPGFADLGGISTTDLGPTRTVTDLNAIEPNKFYRVHVTRP